MRSFVTAIAQALKLTLFPPKCYACQAFRKSLDSDATPKRAYQDGNSKLGCKEIFEKLMRPYLCSLCSGNFLAIESPICLRCGRMFAGRQDVDHLCGDCLKRPGQFERARSVGVYDTTLLILIHQFKYHGRTELARPLGRLLYHAYAREWQGKEIDAILPVPLHRRKLRRRGFNQADLLLAPWAAHFSGQTKEYRAKIKTDILHRVRWTEPQTGLGRQARQHNIKGAFGLTDGALAKNSNVLLIDDVYTTGATVTECARVLKAGGARRVDVLTLARAI